MDTVNAFLGFDGVLILIFIALLFLDFITGLLKARSAETYNSKYTFKGVCRKCGELFLVVAAILAHFMLLALHILLEVAIPLGGVTISINLPGIVLIFLLTYELGSILENLEALGVPVPSIFKKKIQGIQEELDDEDMSVDKKE